jgi:hypothetical protein
MRKMVARHQGAGDQARVGKDEGPSGDFGLGSTAPDRGSGGRVRSPLSSGSKGRRSSAVLTARSAARATRVENPIEQLFAKLKARLRKAAERSIDGLWNRIAELTEDAG